ncbi:MAG: V-type ATP synthase subunit I [Synergistaceae bacterium]
MALTQMSKAQIAVHKSVATKLAEKIQALGCCEFVPQTEGNLDAGSVSQLQSKLAHIDELLSDAKYLMRLLEPYETDKGSSLSIMLGDIRQISLSTLEAKVDEQKFLDLYNYVKGKDDALTLYHSNETRLRGLFSQLKQLEQVKWPLELFTKGTATVLGEIFTVSSELSDNFKNKLTRELGDFFELQELSHKQKDSEITFALLYRREKGDLVQSIATDFSANRVDVPREFNKTAPEEKIKLTKEIDECKEREQNEKALIAAKANEGLEMIRDYTDYWNIVRDRLVSMLSALPTEEVLIWSLWLPTAKLSLVEAKVKEYENMTEFALVEPKENEMPPTLLKNSKWASCVEPLTLMYGTPTYGKVDPSTPMAPFFFLFMAMCFGDAGYGLILTALFGYILVKHRLTPILRKFFVILTIAMTLTIFVGAVTGSWFGDSITAFSFLHPLIPIKDALQFLDPMNDPMTFLIISLSLGFVHIIFGLIIAMYASWKEGDKVAAIFDHAGWIVFLVSLVVMGMAMGGVINEAFLAPSKILSIISVILLIATQGREKKNIFSRLLSGVLSLYNVTGYLGDVLSYSRLLALGLGSAAVGMVINLLGTLVASTPYVGIFLAALIFIVGHTFSILVNLLGAFVHSLRLQYVEFFGKFFDAKGKDFVPLTYVPKYSRLTSEVDVTI